MRFNHRVGWACVIVALLAVAFRDAPAWAGSHTWRVNEIFSSADGNVQFVEFKESCGTPGETGLATHQFKTNSTTVNLANLPPNSSASKHLLFGTANLTTFGGPTPDFIVPAQMLSLLGDLVQYTPFHACTVASGSVPTNGTSSLNISAIVCNSGACPTTVALNTPTNFNGDPGSVIATCIDFDGDGYGSPGDPTCPNGGQTDCNNSVAAINPGATENCADMIDNNCNGLTDCNDTTCLHTAACIPTLSQWGLIIMASLLLVAGTLITTRRPKPVA